jgi:uncharacterized membrane protein
MDCRNEAPGFEPAKHSTHLGSQRMNVGEFERVASLAGGLALGLLGTGRIPWRAAVAVAAGGALVYRGLTGHCHLYGLLGMDTAHRASPARGVAAQSGARVDETILVRSAPDTLYAVWRDFANLPRFMQHLERVEVQDELHSHWVAKAPLGTHVSWDAEIINDRPNELIAWWSIPGSTVDTAGSVRFSQAHHNAPTAVHVELKYSPLGGSVGAALAGILGSDASRMIRRDLAEWKVTMEREARLGHRESMKG